MIVTFEETYLRELYTDGKTKDKKHRYQPEVVRGFQKGVRTLMSAANKENLYVHHALNFEVLEGNYAGKYSIRANKKYRIIFTLEDTSDEPIVTICNIKELSNHYQ